MKIDINNDGSGPSGDFRITRHIELNFWRTCLLNAAGLLLAWLTSNAIEFNNIFSFAFLVVMIWFLNWIIKPVLVVFTLPFIIFTMGIGMLFINAVIRGEVGAGRRHHSRFLLGSPLGVFFGVCLVLGNCDGPFGAHNQGCL